MFLTELLHRRAWQWTKVFVPPIGRCCHLTGWEPEQLDHFLACKLGNGQHMRGPLDREARQERQIAPLGRTAKLRETQKSEIVDCDNRRATERQWDNIEGAKEHIRPVTRDDDRCDKLLPTDPADRIGSR